MLKQSNMTIVTPDATSLRSIAWILQRKIMHKILAPGLKQQDLESGGFRKLRGYNLELEYVIWKERDKTISISATHNTLLYIEWSEHWPGADPLQRNQDKLPMNNAQRTNFVNTRYLQQCYKYLKNRHCPLRARNVFLGSYIITMNQTLLKNM